MCLLTACSSCGRAFDRDAVVGCNGFGSIEAADGQCHEVAERDVEAGRFRCEEPIVNWLLVPE